MNASDVMGLNVITVAPDKSVREAAEIMLARRVSALPVVSESGELVGIVSEGDLMRHADAGTEQVRSWWLRLLMGREMLASAYVKAHSRRVDDVMTRKVVSVSPTTPIREIAALLEGHRIKRVPVVADRKVVGIVSRADLIQMLASAPVHKAATQSEDDRALRKSVLSRIGNEAWARTSLINVTVTDGTADLWGVVDSPAEKKALRVAAEVTPGIRGVTDNTIVRPLDTSA